MLLDQGSMSLRIECVLYIDRNSLCHNRLNSRRIDHLCSEVRKLEGCLVRDVADGAGSRNDLRIRGHHARYVSPDLEYACLAANGVERCGIVRTTASEGRCAALLVRGDEARKHEELGDRIVLHHLVHPVVCLLDVYDVLVALCYCTDDLT